MTYSSQAGKKNPEAQEALSDVSRLLSRMARSRKAPSKLQDIIDLTREVARLGRAMHGNRSDLTDGHGADGYGDPLHFSRNSERGKVTNLIR